MIITISDLRAGIVVVAKSPPLITDTLIMRDPLHPPTRTNTLPVLTRVRFTVVVLELTPGPVVVYGTGAGVGAVRVLAFSWECGALVMTS